MGRGVVSSLVNAVLALLANATTANALVICYSLQLIVAGIQIFCAYHFTNLNVGI